MSTCIKDLYDYDLVKKCRVCQKFLLKSNFDKNSKAKDGLQSQRKFCVGDYNEKYFNKNRDSELECCKNYKFLNREKTNVYAKNKMKTVLHYKLAHNIGSRACQAFKSQNVKK